VTDEAVREIVRIRERLAQLEARLAPREEPMYRDEPTDQDKIQQRLRADAWSYSAELEQVARIKAERPDVYDQQITGSQKMALGLYEIGKAAARKLGRTTGDPR